MNENLPIVERFLSYLIDERAFSPYTSRCYGLDLRQFVEFLEGDLKLKVNPQTEQAALDASLAKTAAPASITGSILSCDVERIRGFLAKLAEQNYSPATMARKIATLRSFHKWLEKRGFTTSNPMTLIRTPKQARRLPKAITVDEVERLLSAPDDTDLLGARGHPRERSRGHQPRRPQRVERMHRHPRQGPSRAPGSARGARAQEPAPLSRHA
jgi:integrase/recombinase XerC